jgi:hypothetical protein
VQVSGQLDQSLADIMAKENIKNPVVKLFWEQQQKNFSKSKQGKRWHPMIIRLALLLHSQSPQVYRSLRDTGVLTLPGESTLRDFTNYIAPKQGFQPEVSIKTPYNKKIKHSNQGIIFPISLVFIFLFS